MTDDRKMAPSDWRGLCKEMANYLQGRKDHEIGWPEEDLEQDLLDRVHALLAQPEPEVVGPTLDDIDEMCERRDFGYYYDDWGPSDQDSRTVLQSMMNEAISRWGRPAPAPAGEVAKLTVEIRHFINGYRQMRGLDPENIYSIHRGDAMEAHITVSGLTRAADLLERQATPVPVAVSERLPEPGDCDAEGRCWLYLPDMGIEPLWRLTDPALRSRYHSHWLPAHALPLPSGETQP